MKNFVHNITYKFIVALMMVIELSFFFAMPSAQAKIEIGQGEFYYSGTEEGEVSIKRNDFFSKLLKTIEDIANVLLGIITLPLRGVPIGWAELAEMLLTKILTLNDNIETINDDAMTKYSQNNVNIESILFNRVKLLDANIFSDEDVDTSDLDIKDPSRVDSVVKILRNAVAKWYYILRIIAVALMLVLLTYIGIKLAISTIASEKSLYKQMLVGWITGMILLFTIHYIMVGILSINDTIVKALEPMSEESSSLSEDLEEYEYGDESRLGTKTSSEIETSLYETARTRAYSLNMKDGFIGMIFYILLIYYAWRFAIIYFRRMLNLMFLTLISPAICITYAFNKSITGKSQTFSLWLNEYVMNTIIQIVHIIIYVSFASIALIISLQSLPSLILAIVIFNFMIKASDVLRKMFNLAGSGGLAKGMTERSTLREMRDDIKDVATAVVGGRVIKGAAKTTLKAASAPVKSGAAVLFGNYMVKKANKSLNDTSTQNADNEQSDEERIENEYIAFSRSKIIKLEEEIEKLEQDKDGNQNEIEEKEKELIAEMERVAENENIYQDAYLKIDLQRENSNWKIIKRGLETAFDPYKYVEPIYKDGRIVGYVRKINKYNVTEFEHNESNDVEKGKRKNKQYIKNWRGKDRKVGFINKLIAGKNDSIGITFKSYFNIDEILGYSDDPQEKKKLKDEIKALKEDIKGTLGGFLAIPMMSISPILGISLAIKGSTSAMDMKARMIKNKASYEQGKAYVFGGVSSATEMNMMEEAYRSMKEVEHNMAVENFEKNHTVLRKIVNSTTHIAAPLVRFGVKFSGIALGVPHLTKTYKLEDISDGQKVYKRKKIGASLLTEDPMYRFYSQKGARKAFSKVKKLLIDEKAHEYSTEFVDEFNSYVSNMEINTDEVPKSLLLSGTYGSIVKAGENIFEIKRTNAEKNGESDLIEKVEEKIIGDENNISLTRKKRIGSAKAYLKENSEVIIENSLFKICAENGIDNIANVDLKKEDVKKIENDFIKVLENKGIISKGEIKVKDIGINEEKIHQTCDRLKQNQEESNAKLKREKLIQDAPKKLKEATTQSVVDELRGKKTTVEELIASVGEAKDAISRTSNEILSETSKEKTKRSEKIKKIDEVKSKLEQQVYLRDGIIPEEDTSMDDSQKNLLNLLLMISECNKEKQKIEHKERKISEPEKRKMQLYGVHEFDRYDTNHRIHGSAQDIVDLIRNANVKGGTII